MLTLELLGHFRMSVGGVDHGFAAHRRTMELLSYLLLHRDAPVRRDFLAFTLFPDADETEARVAFRRNLHILQRHLPPPIGRRPWIVTGGDTVQWNPQAACHIDVVEFERLLETDPAVALDLYKGDLFEGVYEDWVFPERERLRARYLAVLTEMVHACRRERRFTTALQYCGRLLAAEPMREDAIRASMTTRYESGDRAGALADYSAFEKLLSVELGVQPMPETTILRDAIARGETIDPGVDLDAPNDGSESLISAIPLAGRSDELERLYAAWMRAARGRGGAVFVSGEAGIGKTRLASELARLIEPEGARVLRGRTPGVEDAPYQAVSEAIGSVGALLGSLAIEPIWLHVVSTICPQLATFCDATRTLPPVEGAREQTRLFEGAARCFAALAAVRPTLVLLEDAHWAGVASGEMLRVLVHRATAQRLLFVVTFREEEVSRTHHLRKVRHELTAANAASSLALHRLAALETASIVHAIVQGAAADSEVAERIYQQSEGNPLFAVQLACDFAERDASHRNTRTATLNDVIVARLDRLGEAARKSVDVAAVLGAEFDLELVSGILGWAEAETMIALDELLGRHLVREASSRSRFSYAFSHQLVRAAAYDRIESDRRRRYHLLAASAMEALELSRGGNLTVELAGHWENGGALSRAAACWRQAAERALASHAPDEAANYASNGLALQTDPLLRAALLRVRESANNRRGLRNEQRHDIDELFALANDGDDEARCDALARRIALLSALGDRDAQMASIAELRTYATERALTRWASYAARADANLHVALRQPDVAEASAREALRLGIGSAQAEILGHVAISRAMTSANNFDLALAELDLAGPLVECLGDPLVRVAVLDARALTYDAQQKFSASRRVSLEILDIARACGDRLGEARALLKLAIASFRLYDIAAVFEYNELAQALCRSVGDASGLHSLEQNAAAFETSLGRPEQGLQRLRALFADAQRRGDREQIYYTSSNIGVALLQLDRFEEAESEERRALELAQIIGNQRLEALVRGDLGAALSRLGRHAEAIARLSESVEVLERLEVRMSAVNNQARLALALARAGRPEAVALARRAIGLYAADPERFEEPPETLWYLAQVVHAGGEREHAERLVREACVILDARLERMGSPYREAYAAIPWHRELIAARDTDRWPALEELRAEV